MLISYTGYESTIFLRPSTSQDQINHVFFDDDITNLQHPTNNYLFEQSAYIIENIRNQYYKLSDREVLLRKKIGEERFNRLSQKQKDFLIAVTDRVFFEGKPDIEGHLKSIRKNFEYGEY